MFMQKKQLDSSLIYLNPFTNLKFYENPPISGQKHKVRASRTGSSPSLKWINPQI